MPVVSVGYGLLSREIGSIYANAGEQLATLMFIMCAHQTCRTRGTLMSPLIFTLGSYLMSC